MPYNLYMSTHTNENICTYKDYYKNVHRMHEIDGLYELNIGHSIISLAVFEGLSKAVSKMKGLIE